MATLEKFSKGKAFAREDLNCHFLRREGLGKVKFGEASFQICQKIFERKPNKNFFDLNFLLRPASCILRRSTSLKFRAMFIDPIKTKQIAIIFIRTVPVAYSANVSTAYSPYDQQVRSNVITNSEQTAGTENVK